MWRRLPGPLTLLLVGVVLGCTTPPARPAAPAAPATSAPAAAAPAPGAAQSPGAPAAPPAPAGGNAPAPAAGQAAPLTPPRTVRIANAGLAAQGPTYLAIER